MEKNIECRQMIFTARPGYYEWNIFCDDELLYTIDDGSGQIAENITDDTTYLDLRELAVEYVSDLEYEEKIKHTDFHSVVDALTDAWAYHFCIEKPETENISAERLLTILKNAIVAYEFELEQQDYETEEELHKVILNEFGMTENEYSYVFKFEGK